MQHSYVCVDVLSGGRDALKCQNQLMKCNICKCKLIRFIEFTFFKFYADIEKEYQMESFEIRFNMYNLSPDVCYRSVRRSILFLFHDSIRYMELLNFTFASNFISFDFLSSCGTCDKNTKLER